MKEAMSKRAVLCAAASVVAGSTVGVLSQSSLVGASASGCTKANGTAVNCISVTGDGLFVLSSEAALNQVVQVWSGICDYSARWTGTYKNGTTAIKEGWPKDHCSTWRAWLTWAPMAQFKNGSKFCSRFRADVTGNKWTPAACETIKK